MRQIKFIILANMIRYGLIPGTAIAATRILYALFVSADGITSETIGTSMVMVILAVVFGTVLGLYQARNH